MAGAITAPRLRNHSYCEQRTHAKPILCRNRLTNPEFNKKERRLEGRGTYHPEQDSQTGHTTKDGGETHAIIPLLIMANAHKFQCPRFHLRKYHNAAAKNNIRAPIKGNWRNRRAHFPLCRNILDSAPRNIGVNGCACNFRFPKIGFPSLGNY